jgi:trans-aconitate methyltransferase
MWHAETAAVEPALASWLAARRPGHVLELACGTGLVTRVIAPRVARLSAIDASSEVIEINRARVDAGNVDYVQADLFAWRPTQRYDAIFFSFWLSHVPEQRFAEFWQLIAAALAPGGAVYLIDSAFDPTSTAKDHVLPGREHGIVTRKLNDGREFRIVKVFYEPAALAAKLDALGWNASIAQTPHYFIYGEAARAVD